MDFLADPVLLARIQFALTAMYHFVFVPLSIGLGLIVAIFETKYYRSNKPEDAAASRFWIKVFTATFALGVATGITMEFSFGTNWADYAPAFPHFGSLSPIPGCRLLQVQSFPLMELKQF